MDRDGIFAACAGLRRELADVVESLDEAQLATPSLCGAWDVRTVAAHLTVPLTVTVPKFALALAKARGSFDRANDAMARAAARQPVDRIVRTLRDRADSRFTPPTAGPPAPLTDLLVHGGDLRIPLGLPFDPAPAQLAVALGFLAGEPTGFVPKGRLAGIRIAPSDLDGRWGEGAELTGRAADLLMAIAGRRATLDRLAGPGKALL